MNIYQIKELTSETSPYFFSRDTMKFFGQTMSGFRVVKVGGRYKISQNMKDSSGRCVGITVRYFNPVNNELEDE